LVSARDAIGTTGTIRLVPLGRWLIDNPDLNYSHDEISLGARMPFLARAGIRLHYEDAGSGPAIVLHTGGGGDGRMWDRAGYTAALAGYRRLNLDHRGHGASDCPADVSAHRLDEYVQDVVALLDEAGIQRSALVGYSAGARICYAVARRYPDRVSAVAGIGAVGAPGDQRDDWMGAAADVRARGMRAAMEELSAGEPQPAPEWLVDNLAGTHAEMFALLLEAWASAPTYWDDFPHVQVPALLICGEDEEPGAAENARLGGDTLPNGTAVILPGLGHLQAFWRTDQTIPPLVAFLHRHIRPGEKDAH
jgi:pimeloyl-ACP methyl ester carboxylesterase